MRTEVDESGLFRIKCIADCERGARSVIALFASDGNGDFGVLQSAAAAETSLDGEERSFFHLDGLTTGTHFNGTREPISIERGLLTEFRVRVTSLRNRLGFNAVMGSTHGCTRRLMNRIYFRASALRTPTLFAKTKLKETKNQIPSNCFHNGSICPQTIIKHSAAAETSPDGEERSFFYLDGLITGTHLNGTSTLNGVSSSRYLSSQPTWF
ncbi:hypothetical protein CDAR_590991 [Caerostris darwini]|uniref:Uncharacterized protein n=1 Tax=Caerostris darwini TaxID=1538125 RepID=A0AAV4Q0V5_9ARAC|nr:hypothetical protein CDAR_590991 [Caerostris darwini]